MEDPLLSIIVISHNLENYIEKAIKSCDQPQVEIIVIDNASSDRTVELIKRASLQITQPIRLITLSENVGPGPARNIGIEAAHGQFITFLDGDDWYEATGLLKVIKTLCAHTPDVLLFNHSRAWPDGKNIENQNTKLLIEGDTSAPNHRAPLLKNFSVAWNKAYKTSFIRTSHMIFHEGIYEDISWSLLTQIKAKTFWVIPDIVVNYRQRVGSILASTNTNHLNIFNECNRVYSFLHDNSMERKTYGIEVYKYIEGVIFNVVASGHRLPNKFKPSYMREAAEHIEKWRTLLGITSPNLKLVALKTQSAIIARLISYTKKMWPTVKKGRKIARFIFAKIKKISLYSLNVIVYRTSCLLPIKNNKVLFEAYWGAKADCNPLALAHALQAKGGYEIVWCLVKNAQIPENFPFKIVRSKRPAMMFHAARSKYLISNTNLPNEIKKRKNSVHVQTKHGTPLKVMGIDIRKYIPDEMHWSRLVKRSMRWDYVISSNPHSSEAWRSGFPYNYKIIETGYPRNDVFFDKSFDQDALKRKLKIPLDKKVALFAPTARNDELGKKLNISDVMLSPTELLDALGNEYILLVRSHYFLKGFEPLDKNIIDVSDFPVSNEISAISDLLISDYSSIIFDYACLKRPIILHIPDYAEYQAKRGVYFDITAEAPGVVTTNRQELLHILKTKSFVSPSQEIMMKSFHQKFCLWDDGHATNRVLEEVFQIGLP